MKKTKTRRLTSLFFRILGAVAIPLFFLLGVFTFLVLKRELAQTTRFYAQEGRADLEALRHALEELMLEPAKVESPSALRQEIRLLEKALEIEKIDLIDPAREKSILGRPEKPSLKEMTNIRTSLSLKREGKPYLEIIDKKVQRFYGYLPFRDKTRNRILVATAHFHLSSLQEALFETLTTLLLMALFISVTAFFIAFYLTIRIVRPIRAINRACREMLAGRLGLQVQVKTQDELELMADNFNRMSRSLLETTRTAEDANPLTQLPGNQGIFHELSKRIVERQKFVLFHGDLNRFKVFNDRYGLARGDEAIQKTANLLKQAVEEFGTESDFVGHQGGDDFVLILSPKHAKEIAEYVIRYFDAEIVKTLYRREDYDRGYTLDLDRRWIAETGEERMVKFPLLSISLAGIANAKRDFADYFDCMNAAVAAKKEIKKKVESAYMILE